MSLGARDLCIRNGNFELRDVNFEIPTGKCAAISGSSGVGKTTLIEGICGLLPITAGTLLVGDTAIHATPPWNRNIGFVPQEGVLFEQMSVQQHLEFALQIRKWSRDDRISRVADLLKFVELEALKSRKPNQLSGGQCQRLAIARAVSFQPDVLCLDEPFSWLDQEASSNIAGFIGRIAQEFGTTILLVTHRRDDIEAIADLEFVFRDQCLVPFTELTLS